MNWIVWIIFGIVAIGWLVFLILDIGNIGFHKCGIGDFLGLFFLWLASVFAIGVLAFIVDDIVNREYYKTPQETYVEEKIELVSLGDTTLTGGHFVLGSGSVNEVPVYSFYRELENGNKVRDYRYACESEIDDSLPSGEVPYVEKIVTIYPSLSFHENERKFIFHVPEGTIVQEYRLDNN